MKARIFAVTLISLLFGQARFAHAQGTSFTYQGKLNADGVAANGSFDFQFGLYTNVAVGNFTGALVTNAATVVSNGLFTTTINFGNVFSGVAYWLEIGVRTNGSTGVFNILSPRQAITPAPYAITAGNASNLLGTLPASQLSGSLPSAVLSGAFSNAVTFTNATNVFSGNGSGLTGVSSVTQTNYLFVTSTNLQAIVTAGAFQTLTFSLQSANAGWGTSLNGIFTVPQSGLYLVEYQVHVQNEGQNYSSPNIAFGVRGILNSATEIAGSESFIDIPPAFGAGILTRSFMLALTAGQTLSLQVTANAAGGLAYVISGAFAGESYPGVSLTIVRIQ